MKKRLVAVLCCGVMVMSMPVCANADEAAERCV